MGKLVSCVIVECRKFVHSKVPLVTLLALIMVPFMGGFFMFILKDPDLARSLGLISAKAQIVGLGTADWPTYYSLLTMAISAGGLMAFGFVFSWIFGREYSEKTITDLLALPVSRSTIVLSKFVVAALWCLALSAFVFLLSLLVGKLVAIPGWSVELLGEGTKTFFICAVLTILLSTPVAFFASAGRGYLAPLGFVVFTLVLAQLAPVIGYGQYFPWSVPSLLSGAVGNYLLGTASFLRLFVLSISGVVATLLWWRYADQD